MPPLVLDRAVFQEIVDLLTPHMADAQERRALLRLALGPNASLLKRLEFEGAAEQFSVRVIDELVNYGEIEPGEDALWALLEKVRDRVGIDRQARIDALRSIFNLPRRDTKTHSRQIRFYLKELALLIDRPSVAFEHVAKTLGELSTPVKACLCLYKDSADEPGEFARAVALRLAAPDPRNPDQPGPELLRVLNDGSAGESRFRIDAHCLEEYEVFSQHCYNSLLARLEPDQTQTSSDFAKLPDKEKQSYLLKLMQRRPRPLVVIGMTTLVDRCPAWLRWFWGDLMLRRAAGRWFDFINKWNEEWETADCGSKMPSVALLFCLEIPTKTRTARNCCFALAGIEKNDIHNWFALLDALLRANKLVDDATLSRTLNQWQWELDKRIGEERCKYPLAFSRFRQFCEELSRTE